MEWSRFISIVICFFSLGPFAVDQLQAQTGCDLVIEAGADQFFCEGNQEVTLSAQVDGDYLDLNWLPADGIADPALPVTQASVDTTITYTLSVRSRSAVNLITNGDFSQGDAGFTSDYIYGTGGSSGLLTAEGQYAIDDNPGDTHNRFADCPDHTTGNGNMMIVNASGMEDNFWCQSVTVNEGVSYDFSAWVTSVNEENPAQLQFSIDGQLLGNQFNASGDLCTWEEFSAQWTAPSGSTVEICVVNVNLTPAGNDFAIDDIAFQEICVATDSITLSVIDLNADWSAPGPLCQNDDLLLLDDLTADNATPGGIWTFEGETVASLDPSKLNPGQYVLQYTVTEATCQQTNEQMIEVLDAPYAGAPGPTLRYCEGTEVMITLADELEGEDPGGIWTETSLVSGPADSFDPASSNLDIAPLPAGNYSFNYTVGANGPCGGSENEIRIIIDPIPAIDLGEDRSLNCDNTELELGTGISQNPAYAYVWTDQGGNTIGTSPQLTVNTAGTYQLAITDLGTNCRGQDEIVITEASSDPITAAAQVINPSCFDTNDGIILIENTDGGTAPYLYALNDNPFGNESQFSNLSPGNYQINIMDAAGCSQLLEVVLSAPSELQVAIITDNPVVNLGDSIRLEAEINNRVAQISWTPTPNNCSNCPQITVRPTQSTTYFVQVVDENGCTASAQLAIQVKRNIDVFVPNAFSPNEDGVNDLFYINAAEGIHIRQLQIADRWGNIVFQRTDFAPNDPGTGWDGYFRGSLIPSGVLVYTLELELPSGEPIIQSGELAVIY